MSDGSFGSAPAGHAPLDHGHKSAPASSKKATAVDADSQSLDLQESAGNSAVASMLGGKSQASRADKVASVLESPGQPIDSSVASMVGETSGADASGIVVHEGDQAADAAKSVEAEMFASGNHIVAPKGLDVSTVEGVFQTVHEVHHIVNQQAKGEVDGTDTGDGLSISDPSDRFEQEANEAGAEAVAKKFS